MIVNDQKNVKVHFAGIESIPEFAGVAGAGVRYMLCSAFKCLAVKFGITTFSINHRRYLGAGYSDASDALLEKTFYAKMDSVTRHHIMDSGLFTLMWGAAKGTPVSILERWHEALIDHIVETEFAGTCVEMDCQKVLSPEAAWKYRERLRDAIPNRIINVFHLEDGAKGLDRLIEFTDYIAISIPELRQVQKTRQALPLVYYIKNKKPDIDIHLLGCTSDLLLQRLKFCTSADSTSWKAPFRWGKLYTRFGKEMHVTALDKSPLLVERMIAKTRTAYETLGLVKLGSDKLAACTLFAACESLLRYKRLCGDQW